MTDHRPQCQTHNITFHDPFLVSFLFLFSSCLLALSSFLFLSFFSFCLSLCLLSFLFLSFSLLVFSFCLFLFCLFLFLSFSLFSFLFSLFSFLFFLFSFLSFSLFSLSSLLGVRGILEWAGGSGVGLTPLAVERVPARRSRHWFQYFFASLDVGGRGGSFGRCGRMQWLGSDSSGNSDSNSGKSTK